MQQYSNYSRILASGAPAPLATITVYPRGEVVPADIFDTDGSTPKANPFTTDVNGFFSFQAPNGRYDIRLSGGGIVTPYSWTDILFADLGNAGPAGVTQSLLGGSRAVSAVVSATPETVDAVEWLPTVIPADADLPPGAVITAFLSCQVGAGSSVVLKIVNAETDVLIVADPVPFTDADQFVEHEVNIPLQATAKLAKLVATVTNGADLPLFFFGDIRYTIVTP